MALGIFKIALRLRDRHVFRRQSLEILNVFDNLILNFFWKTKTFLKKLEDRFLVESTMIENATIPHKTVLSKANAKTNRMKIRKWTYHKQRGFATNYFIFSKI